MLGYKRLKIYIALILIVSLLTGCGAKETITPNVVAGDEAVKTAMLDEADITYEVPRMYPLISVDKVGYEPSDKKIAVIVSDNLPARFQIVDKATGEDVYTGTVKLSEIENPDERLTGIADFTDFETEGEYFIEADIVGCSEPFAIKNGIYAGMLTDAFKGLDSLRCDSESAKCHMKLAELESDASVTIDVSGGWHTDENGQKDVVEGCVAASDLMLAYEYYRKSYSDNMGIAESGNNISDIVDEIRYELEWLLKMQNTQSGGVYSLVSSKGDDGEGNDTLILGGETTKATAYFCATMARYSYLCGDVDRSFANKCMKAANLAWKCLEANKSIVGKDQMYRAAVEMYRATGYKVYSDIILDYLKDNAGKPYENRLNLDAAISYLDTPRYISKEYCSALMETFMDKTERHAGLAQNSRYLVESDELTTKELLRNACELVIVDYIISSSEYGKIEKNYLHYLGGRNEKSIDFLNFGCDPDSYAELILVLGRLNK